MADAKRDSVASPPMSKRIGEVPTGPDISVFEDACRTTFGLNLDADVMFTVKYDQGVQTLLQAMVTLTAQQQRRLADLEASNGMKANRNDLSMFHLELQNCLKKKDLAVVRADLNQIISECEEKVQQALNICKSMETDVGSRLTDIEDRLGKLEGLVANKVDKSSIAAIKELVAQCTDAMDDKLGKRDAGVLITSKVNEATSTMERQIISHTVSLETKSSKEELEEAWQAIRNAQVSLSEKAESDVMHAITKRVDNELKRLSDLMIDEFQPKLAEEHRSMEWMRQTVMDKADLKQWEAHDKSIHHLNECMRTKADTLQLEQDLDGFRKSVDRSLLDQVAQIQQEVIGLLEKTNVALEEETKQRSAADTRLTQTAEAAARRSNAERTRVDEALATKADLADFNSLTGLHAVLRSETDGHREELDKHAEELGVLHHTKASVALAEEKADMRYCEEVFMRFGKEFDRSQTEMTTLTDKMKALVQSVTRELGIKMRTDPNFHGLVMNATDGGPSKCLSCHRVMPGDAGHKHNAEKTPMEGGHAVFGEVSGSSAPVPLQKQIQLAARPATSSKTSSSMVGDAANDATDTDTTHVLIDASGTEEQLELGPHGSQSKHHGTHGSTHTTGTGTRQRPRSAVARSTSAPMASSHHGTASLTASAHALTPEQRPRAPKYMVQGHDGKFYKASPVQAPAETRGQTAALYFPRVATLPNDSSPQQSPLPNTAHGFQRDLDDAAATPASATGSHGGLNQSTTNQTLDSRASTAMAMHNASSDNYNTPAQKRSRQRPQSASPHGMHHRASESSHHPNRDGQQLDYRQEKGRCQGTQPQYVQH